jgi:hypothetical protein
VGIALYYFIPILLMGIAAALGVGSVVFFRGGFAAKDVASVAITLAAGIPGVAAISYAMSGTEGEYAETYGALMKHFWAWCLAAYIIVCIFGGGMPH